MGILRNAIDWIAGPRAPVVGQKKEIMAYVKSQQEKIQIREYALELCINKIANALSLADFETYIKGKIVQEKMWWLFNFEPNQNQTQIAFISDIVRHMVKNADGALVIQSGEQFIVAKSFDVEYRAFLPNLYKNIEVAGDYRLNKVYTEDEVLHFVLNDSKISSYLDGLYSEYGKLISGAIRNYNRNNALKLGLNISTMFDQQFGSKVVDTDKDGQDITEADVIIDEMYENRFKAILSDTDSITPLEEGLSISNVVDTKTNTKSGAVTTGDISDTISIAIDFAADAFSIPKGIMRGDVADAGEIRENFVNFAVRPFADVIETEVNRKLYRYTEVRKGNKLKIQTNTILIYSIEKFAASAEALLRIGAYNPDEIRKKLGEEPLDTDMSKAYYVTKNYATESEMMELKGGEKTNGQKADEQDSETS